jgi:cystathionine beta-lyase
VSSPFDVPIDELRRRRSYKWRAYPADVLPAFVAEMDFAPAPPIAAALEEAIAIGDTGYAWNDPALGEAYALFARERYGWAVAPSNATAIPDVMAGVVEALRLVCRPGDGVVVNTPVYPPFFTHIAEAGCRVVEAPLMHHDGRYEIDFASLERALAQSRVYLLCNPHNPTGRVFSAGELERVSHLAVKHDAFVFADEIHAPLVLPGSVHTPFLTLGDAAAARSLAFVSASKAWNLPGLKCAQVVAGSPQMRAVLDRLTQDFTFRTGNLGLVASIAAYRDGGDWLTALLRVLDGNRTLMQRLLAVHLPNTEYTPPEGGYLGWVDCSRLHLGAEPATVFLERGRVALRPGSDFGTGGKGFVRVTLGTSPALVTELVERMAVAVR